MSKELLSEVLVLDAFCIKSSCSALLSAYVKITLQLAHIRSAKKLIFTSNMIFVTGFSPFSMEMKMIALI